MNKNSKILIVGHNDSIENSLYQYFESNGYNSVFSSTRLGLNTTVQSSVYHYFQDSRPEYVFLGSVASGGIEANKKYAAEFIYQNLESQNSVMYAAQKFGVKKLLYYGSSCVYPVGADQPMSEDLFLSGPVESTSEPYAIAKMAGIKLCQAFKQQYDFNAIVMIPATIYGPHADQDAKTAHVLGALIKKFMDAKKNNDKSVSVWGSGLPRREFLFEQDFVEASMHLMKKYEGEEIVNVGSGEDISIKELAYLIKEIVGFAGEITFDESKPDGAMQKLLNSQRMKTLGFEASTSLEDGVRNILNKKNAGTKQEAQL